MKLSAYDRRVNARLRILRAHALRMLLDPFDAPPLAADGRKRLAILGLGRSGTSLLVDLLNGDPNTRCDGEIFQHWRSWPKCELARRVAEAPAVYGFKLLSYQTNKVLGFHNGAGLLDWLDHSGFVFVHVRRRDLFRHALSQISARQTRFHLDRSDASREKTYVAIDDLEAWMARIRMNAANDERIIGDRPRLSLIYEDDLIDEAAQRVTIDKIAEFLGAALSYQPSRFRKIVTGPLSKSFVNGDELEAYASARDRC